MCNIGVGISGIHIISCGMKLVIVTVCNTQGISGQFFFFIAVAVLSSSSNCNSRIHIMCDLIIIVNI